MIFIDLNAEMAPDVSDENRPALVDSVNRRLARYEKLQLDEGKTAYVFVTNMTFHRHLLESAQMICIPGSVGISDFNRTGTMKLSEIYRRDQKHADAFRIGASMQKLLSFPTTFDGTLPSEALYGDRPPVQIGQKYNFEGAGPGDTDLCGEVTDAIVDESAKEAIVAVYTDDKQAYLLKERMTDAQIADYRAHKEAYFGKIKYVPNGIETPYDLFLFFVEGQKEMTRAKLLESLKLKSDQAEGRTDEDLLLELCERQVAGSGMFEVVDGVLTSKPKSKK
jgi:hypothetical protein